MNNLFRDRAILVESVWAHVRRGDQEEAGRAHARVYPVALWHLDEVFVKINGKLHYLWRPVDHEGEVLETVVTAKRDEAAALKFLKRIMKNMADQRASSPTGSALIPPR